MARRRQLVRGIDIPVELLAEATGRSPATIRRAQSQGPSKRLAQDLALLAASFAPVRRRRRAIPRKPVAPALKPASRKPNALAPKPAKPAKPAPKPVLRKQVKPAPKQAPRKSVKSALKPAPRRSVKAAPKPAPRRSVKAAPKPTPHRPVKAAPKPASRRPVKTTLRPAPHKPAKPTPKPVLRKPVKPTPKPTPRKPVKPTPKPAPRKPRKPTKPRKPRKPVRYPSFLARAAAAESIILDWLGHLQDLFLLDEPALDTDVKSFINRDSTVDGELRLRNLPEEWRSIEGLPLLVATLSEAIRATKALPHQPPGGFWVSFGLRFGPKDQHEIEEMAKFYKRFRGLFQVGAYHTSAESIPAILNNALAVRDLVERVWAKRDLPPVQLLVRIVWTPDGKRPGRFAGEQGMKE